MQARSMGAHFARSNPEQRALADAKSCTHRAVRYSKLRPYQLAEMLRTPLEELSLQISVLNLGRISDFLDKATQRPIFPLPRPSTPRPPARTRASLSHTRV